MGITGGIGFELDTKTGRVRDWYFKDGVKRWADDNSPAYNVQLPNDVARCAGVGSDTDGWRDGCECCARRLSGAATNGRTIFIAPPETMDGLGFCDNQIESR